VFLNPHALVPSVFAHKNDIPFTHVVLITVHVYGKHHYIHTDPSVHFRFIHATRLDKVGIYGSGDQIHK